jgi:membrane-bound lytic murein transglycosylase B
MILTVVTLFVALIPFPILAEKQGFEVWLAGFRTEALDKGISQATLDETLSDLKLLPRVIELDRNQPEFKLTLEEYLDRVVTESRVVIGRKKLAENRSVLAVVSRLYGVQPRFLMALWGIETRFGRVFGNFPVIAAVATLAYDGRRSAFFRSELLDALRILDENHISLGQMRGSWAGAMGQLQFMPSTFRRFATDYEGDGRIDIWNNLDDVFASAGNYLFQSGWVRNQTWGYEVRLPKGFDRALVGLKTTKRLSAWQGLGVRHPSGGDLLKKPGLLTSLVEPDGPAGRAFVVYDNYRAILKWNRSHYFGIAVGTLADRIAQR